MQIRYTSKAKKAIDQASKMSKSLHHHYIGTEHILIGLLKEGTGVAAQVLNDNGVELDKVMPADRGTHCTGCTGADGRG